MKIVLLVSVLTTSCSGHSEGDLYLRDVHRNSEYILSKRDSNRDKRLSIDEYLSGAVVNGSGRIASALKREFVHSDKDHDGYLSLNEIVAPRVAWFSCVDQDLDGKTNTDEIQDRISSCSNVGLSVTEEYQADINRQVQ
jgi:hypothetical protein